MAISTTAHIKDCYGCGVCVAACPHNALWLRLDKRGFYAPYMLNEKACTRCGMCLNVCSYAIDELSVKKEVLEWGAMWSKNPVHRQLSTSGGVVYEIAQYAIENGYEVVGVRYNAKEHKAEHVICTKLEDIDTIRGSKYIQSYTVDAFEQLSRNKKYLVIGTPCQIDSLRRWVEKRKLADNFVFLDFFCHGVPSYWVWRKYLRENFRDVEIDNIDFRSKHNHATNETWPWHASFVITCHDMQKGVIQPNINKRDWFYHYFLEDICFGKACYEHCKFRMYNSAADVRVGDAWGSAYEKEEKGVSAVLVYTEKGRELLRECVDRIEKEDIALDLLCEDQMPESPQMPPLYDVRLWLLHHTPFTLHTINRMMNGLLRFTKHKR